MTEKVKKRTLGGVNVRLRNKERVNVAFLDDIFSKSRLCNRVDNRELLLKIDTKEESACKAKKQRGVTIPVEVFARSKDSGLGYDSAKRVTRVRDIDSYLKDIDAEDLLQKYKWDAWLYIPKITADRWKNYRPYFACVLGHELEHVKVIRENLEFHMCATWLLEHHPDIVSEAGKDVASQKTWDHPLERHCNKQGKRVAVRLFGEEGFDKCIAELKPDETDEHRETLDFLCDLAGEPYNNIVWKSIFRDIQDYYKDKGLETAVHKIWSESQDLGDQFDLEKFIPLP